MNHFDSSLDSILAKYILGPDGVPVREDDILAWGEWMETHWLTDRIIAHDEFADCFVSTIFLGNQSRITRQRRVARPIRDHDYRGLVGSMAGARINACTCIRVTCASQETGGASGKGFSASTL